VTVTVPAGVPAPEVTLNVTVTAAPETEGLGPFPVIVVVVAAGFTPCATPADTDPAKFPSVAYVAVNVRATAVGNAN
jgi:hypothetical protein